MMRVSYSQITSLLQKFTPGELKSLIPVLFSEIGWDAVSSSIRKNRLSCQSKFIAMTTTSLYEATNPTTEDLQIIFWALQFFDKIHHNSQDWHGIQLANEFEEVSETHVIERNIIRAFRTEARDAEVMLKVDDDLIYIMTVEKKTSPKGVKYGKPFFFVHNFRLNEPYGFYSPKATGYEDYLTFCCKGLGYENYEEILLFGNDIISLFGMIERDVNASRSLQVVKDFKPVTVVEEDAVVDFTLSSERARYAEEVLPGLTNLQTYTVQANNEWRGAPYLPEMEGIKVDSAITFTSAAPNVNVEDMFKEMIKRGMVHLPLPAYIANFPHVPRNTVELREDESHFSDDSN
ncbi:uncharacterized protein isoform X1 [Rhodnius prolixus]